MARMKFLENTWLYRMWRTDKILFAVIVFYMAGILWFVRYQREEFPFLLYGMYSLKEEAPPSYTTYLLKMDGREVYYTKLWDLEKELIISPLSRAVSLSDQGELSKQEMNRIYAWLFRYMGDMRMIGNNRFEVYRLTCGYNEEGKVEIIHTQLITDYHAD